MVPPMSGPDVGRRQAKQPGASVARVADRASLERSNRGPANVTVGAAVESRPHAGPPTLTPDMVRHLQRSAGNSATAALLRRHGMVVARQDAAASPPGTSPALPQRGTKEYQEKAEQSKEPGELPKLGNLVPAPLREPGTTYESDPNKGVKWDFGKQSVNIPVTLPGVGISAGIGGFLEANASLSGKLKASWRRVANISPLPLPVMDHVSVEGALDATGHVAGGIHAYVGAGVKGLAEAHVKVGGSAQLDGRGTVNISGTAARDADPLAKQFQRWRTGGETSFNFTGQLVIAAGVSFQWKVLVVGEGEERLFSLGSFVAGTVTASGTFAYLGGDLVTRGLNITVGSGVAAQQVKGNTGPPQRPAQDRTSPATVAPLRVSQRETPHPTASPMRVQRARGPDEEPAEPGPQTSAPSADGGAAATDQGSGAPKAPADEGRRVDDAKKQAADIAAQVAAAEGGVVSAMAPSEGEEDRG